MNKKLIIGAIVGVALLLSLAFVFPSRPNADPIASAKQLLLSHGIEVPPYTIELTDQRPKTATSDVAMWVYMDTQVIWVLTTTPIWSGAKAGDAGDIMILAAMLVHEGVHAGGDSDEAHAYDAEIEALDRMGADQSLIDGVQRAKEEALTR
jgi:hypothetical protein